MYFLKRHYILQFTISKLIFSLKSLRINKIIIILDIKQYYLKEYKFSETIKHKLNKTFKKH